MAPNRSKRRPSFFWQGMFILLPVGIMAAISLTALVRDRAAAEREARQRAEELLDQVGNGFERAMGFQLSQLELGPGGGYSRLWSQQHLTEAALWPGSEGRRQAEQERHLLATAYEQAGAAFEELARVSGLRPEEIMLAELAFTPVGTVSQPTEQAREPQPAAWRLELTAEQLQALKGLEQLDAASASSAQIEAALKRFLDTDPSGPAQANAEFIRLRLLLANEPASKALPQWLEFAQHCAGEQGLLTPALSSPGGEGEKARPAGAPVSESGVPLSSLAVAKALQGARETGATEALWTGLVREVGRAPGAFTPMLLDLAEPLAQSRPELQSCLEALRLRWAVTERTWEAADEIRRSGRLQGITTTNFWLEFKGTRWLCLLQPGQSWVGSGPSAVTNWFTQARLCPQAGVEQALRKVVQNSKLVLPAYLRLSAEVEGDALNSPSPPPEERAGARRSFGPPSIGGKSLPSMTLAQTEGRLTCPATVENRMEPASRAVEFESMPGRPRFMLRLELADRALLFAAQRRRTWLYGSLVLAAALTAAVGFGAAYRSFHRQLRLSEMKSNFVSSVSHELRAPIASVRLMAESLERGKVVEVPKQQEYFRFIGQECRRLSSLIENVLDFSRIERGRKQYEFEPTDLVELTRQTVQVMETYAAERGVKLALAECRVSGGECQGPDAQLSTLNSQLSVDGKALQQALINLIDNALKHSPKGETVSVGLEMRMADGGWRMAEQSTKLWTLNPQPSTLNPSLALWVEDHGVGIPASEQEKIFERFYRLGSELRRETPGVGIGLSIVKHVVEAHGGRVRVRSAVGEGSRFTIELPVAPQTMKSEGRGPKAE